MIFVDTAYLHALVKSGDHLSPRARAWAGVLAGPLLTTDYVLWELMNGLSKVPDRPIVHALIADIRKSASWQLITASASLFNRGLALHRQSADKEWSLTDCISFLVMRERHISQALTHDRHFEQAGFEALLRRDPP
jgi:uncharacterized protein